MADHIGRVWRGMMVIATVGIFDPGPTGLRAEVLAQAGAGITFEAGTAEKLSPEEVRNRGVKLRADLDKAFNALPDSGKAGHADELTAIVRPYIPAGTVLDEAVGILGAAGFTEPKSPGTERYAVVAEIPQFSGRVFGNVDAYVMLLSPAHGLAEYIGRRHRMMYYPGP